MLLQSLCLEDWKEPQIVLNFYSTFREDKPLTDQLPEIEAQGNIYEHNRPYFKIFIHAEAVMYSDVSILVEEVHRSGVDADTSDSDAGSAVTTSHQSTTSKDTSYRKVIGRSHSVSSTGSFVATSEWVNLHF